MKNLSYSLLLAGLVLGAGLADARGSVTISLQFQAYDAAGDPVPVGSLGVLVADTSGDGFSFGPDLIGSALGVGSVFGAADNVVIGRFEASDMGGVNGHTNNLVYFYEHHAGFGPGDSLAFYWFPALTGAATVVGSGLDYGYYRTDAVDVVSGSHIAFVAPADGSVSTLAVFDQETFAGALATKADLTASFSVVPEPSACALLAGLVGLGCGLTRRRRL